MSTDNIKLFIQENYTDTQLAALIVHTESGRLSYYSCCCPIGGSTASHPLQTAGEYVGGHFWAALRKPYGRLAHDEAYALGGPDDSDQLRRERLLPILYAEVERREMERDYEDEPYWSDADTTREMVNSIKGR